MGIVETIVGMALLAAALGLAVPALTLALQCLLGATGRPRAPDLSATPRPRLGLLIPAHNEAQGLPATLASVQAQLQPGDRCLVIADNCSDATAAVARAAGVEVTERQHATRRGKGYALDHGLQVMLGGAGGQCGEGGEGAPRGPGRPGAEAAAAAAALPAVIVIVDADCLLDPGALDQLGRACAASGRPVQADYAMALPEPLAQARLKRRFAAFAWAVKNSLRPGGAARLGAPCQLMGTGMAFPVEALRGAALASGNIVEDMKLGLDLALQGRAPRYLPTARVHSQFPQDGAASAGQRTRWEHGHLATLLAELPRLLPAALRRRDAELLALALDLAVPPLALLTLLAGGLLALASVLGLAGWSGPLGGLAWALAAVNLGLIALAIGLAWAAVGRPYLRAGELLAAPVYALGKIGVYLRFLVKRQSEWVRARRDHE